jgi:hypothetical protein
VRHEHERAGPVAVLAREDVLRGAPAGEPPGEVEGAGQVAEGQHRHHRQDDRADERLVGRHEAPGDRGDRVDQVRQRPVRPDLERLELGLAAQLAQPPLEVPRGATLGVRPRPAPRLGDDGLDIGHYVHAAGQYAGGCTRADSVRVTRAVPPTTSGEPL